MDILYVYMDILPGPGWRKEAFSGLLFIFLLVLNSA